jgi:hypothetical protein
MKTCLGEWKYSVLDLGTRWRQVISFTLRPLYPQRKSLWCPLDRRLGGPQSRSGRGGKEKNSQPLPELEPPIIQPVALRCTTSAIIVVRVAVAALRGDEVSI